MLNFLILDDKNLDYKKIFSDIDAKIFQISKKALYNAKYGLFDKVNYNLAGKLSTYKSIIKWKLACPNCTLHSIEDIISKIKRLINKDGPLPLTNSLQGCLEGNCD